MVKCDQAKDAPIEDAGLEGKATGAICTGPQASGGGGGGGRQNTTKE